MYMAEKAQDLFMGLIVENAFTSMSDLFDHHYWFSKYINWVLEIEWDNLAIAKKLTLPVLYIAGKTDQVVPYSHSVKLHEETKNASFKDLYIVTSKSTHTNLFHVDGDFYLAKLQFFMQECFEKYTRRNLEKSKNEL